MASREENEKNFGSWIDHADGTRVYWYEVKGKRGWRARYTKVVDSNEKTLSFLQEVYDGKGDLVELHKKYPVDGGHQTLKR